MARQYSVASPRNGERPGYNNVSLTVKRVTEDHQGRPVRGVASNFVGPLGPSYSIADNSADYGTVSPDDTTDCYNATPSHDCYAMTISGARPSAMHRAIASPETGPALNP